MEEAFAYFNLCTSCNTCYITCPIYKVKKLQSFAPRSRITIAGLIAQNRIDINSSKRLVESIFSCVLCDMCHNVCPSGVDIPKTVKATRKYLVNQKLSPSGVNSIIESIKKYKNIFSLDNEDRLDWTEEVENIIKDKINKKTEIAFYVGCQQSFKGSLYMMPESMVKILDKAGIDFTLLGGEEWCCGNPAFLVGDRSDEIKEIAKHNVEKMENLGVKKVIMTCPGCYKAWKFTYPELLGIKKLPFEIVHSTEFIFDLIKTNKIEIAQKYENILGYQDPCDLARISGIFEEPRDIIKSIPQVKIVELEDNRQKATCCGGGGLCKASYEPIASEIASNKIDEFVNAGVETLLTACPACYDNFASSMNDRKDIQLKDIHELIVKLLK